MSSKSTGEFIKELRKERNLSQQQLADLTKIDRTNISKYETGEREPSYFNLEEISKVFNISMTELLAGERKVEDYEKVDASIKKIFKNMIKFKHLLKIIIFCSILLVSSLIIYITILNYTSTKVYKVYVDSDDIRINNGLLVKTKDRMYLTFKNTKVSDKVEQINIYYKENNNKEYFIKTTELDSIYFVEDINNKEYSKTQNFNKLLNNIYIELVSNEEVIKVEKLNFEFDYSNKTLNNEKDNSVSAEVENSNFHKSEIYDMAKEFINSNQDKTFNIKYDGINYKMEIFENNIQISYFKNDEKYVLSYDIYNDETILKQKYNKFLEKIYFYNIRNNLCELSGCENYKTDIKLIKKLIEKVKK